MRTASFYVIESLLITVTLITMVYICLILYLDGYTIPLSFVTIQGHDITPPTIVFLCCMLLCFLVHGRGHSGKLLATRGAAIIFCISLILYLANGTTKTPGDAIPARYLPLSILREGNFDLNEFPFLYTQEMPYYLRQIKGLYLSQYPVGPAISALPFYLLSAIGHVALDSALVKDLEKLAAASQVALSASILYLIVRRLSNLRHSLLITIAYAFGTSCLSASSQGLWQHGPSQLALMTTLYGLVRGRQNAAWIAVAGFSLAFATICRPTNVLQALPLSVYVALYHRAYIGRFVLGGLPPGLFQLWYNSTYFGHPLLMPYPSSGWSSPLWEGLIGILMSPGRGLFVYSPIFLGAFVGMALAWRHHGDPLLRTVGVGVISTLLLYSRWGNWWGGFSYGPRLLADLTPALSICLVPLGGCLEKSRSLRWTFFGLLLWSLWAHGLGAFEDDGRWNASPLIDLSPHRNWSVRGSPLVEYTQDVFARVWIALRRLPTSQSAPESLSAAYRCDSATLQITMPSTSSACPLRLCLTAYNSGAAVWLSTAKNRQGAVMLAWRWMKEGEAVPGLAGFEPLRHAVFPGHSYEFQLPVLPMPSTPGRYALELELLSFSISRFSDHGIAPVTIPVSVPTWTPEILQQYLNTPVRTSAETPLLAIAIDRLSYHAGDDLQLSMVLTVMEKPVLIDVFFALLRPDGHVDFFSGERPLKGTGEPIPAASRTYLHKRSRLSSSVSLRLVDELPPGGYTLYAFVTEASSYQMLARATALFRIEP